ncbi:hypothetical protein SESBI_07864 [Sesbania bispinosa]|nr:hypothetical protein SESBI_07864 [Sesbania bispinosa]
METRRSAAALDELRGGGAMSTLGEWHAKPQHGDAAECSDFRTVEGAMSRQGEWPCGTRPWRRDGLQRRWKGRGGDFM